MPSGVTLNQILEGVQAALVSNVDALNNTNCHISAHGEEMMWPWEYGEYGCAIFYRTQDAEGFAGGMEMKAVFVRIAMIHVRTTDQYHRDFRRFRDLCLALHEEAIKALQANFLGGILDEPLQLITNASGFKQADSHIKMTQEWRCMHNDFLIERIESRNVIGP